MMLNFIGTLAFALLFPLLPEFNAKFLHGTDITFGLITSAFGIGGLVAGPISGPVGDRFGKGKVLYATFCADGLFMLLFGLTPVIWANLSVTALWGISGFVLYIAYVSLMQEIVPSEKRGRIFSISQLVWSSAMLIAQGVAAVLGGLIQAQHILIGAGLLYFIAIVTARGAKGFEELLTIS
jgi:MFS family permease